MGSTVFNKLDADNIRKEDVTIIYRLLLNFNDLEKMEIWALSSVFE